MTSTIVAATFAVAATFSVAATFAMAAKHGSAAGRGDTGEFVMRVSALARGIGTRGDSFFLFRHSLRRTTE